MDGWVKLKARNNWETVTLHYPDGRKFDPPKGVTVLVRWPNGVVTAEEVGHVVRRGSYSDHGFYKTTVVSHIPAAMVSVNGVVSPVRLDAEGVEVEAPE